MNLSIIIPAYNEEKNIEETILELFSKVEDIEVINNVEVLVMDDHSSDETLKVLSKMKDARVRGVKLSRRSGSHVALRAGLDLCSGDLALCISADGQDNPETLKKMVEKTLEGYNIVWGVRKKRKEPFLKSLFARLFYQLLKSVVGQKDSKIDLASADFYLLDRKVIEAIKSCGERNTSLFGLIVWLGFAQAQVRYSRRERRFGSSKWNFKSRMKLATDWIIGFSGIPLRLITYVGLLVASIGFIYALIILVLAIMEYTTPGWAETTILLLIIGGIQLVMIGVLGEYLWRNLDESRKRPNYFIEKDTNQEG